MRSVAFVVGLCLVLSARAAHLAAAPDVDRSAGEAPSLVVRALDGTEHRPLQDAKVRAAVLVFVLTDCPVSNGYAPEIQRLAAEFGKRDVAFFLVHVDPDVTAAQAKRHAEQFGLTSPVALDPRHGLVRLAGARRVPEVAVFVPGEGRKYRGRIDDRYFAPGKRRAEPASHDLRAALEAVLAGKPVPRAETEAIGCPIPDLPD
jgi:hypothetical protein